MTLEEFRTLLPGDKVAIVDKWPYPGGGQQNKSGKMDKWLGKTMTILKNDGSWAFMTEDREAGDRGGSGWTWYPSLIAGRPAVKAATETDISDFLGL